MPDPFTHLGTQPRIDPAVVGAGGKLPNIYLACPKRGQNQILQKDTRFCSRATFVVSNSSGKSQNPAVLCCMFDTGAMVSIFSSDAAKDLKLKIPTVDPQVGYVRYADGRKPKRYQYHEFRATISTSDRTFVIPIRFPVREYQAGRWKWVDWVTGGENIIGMKGFVTSNMLCFTREALYIFRLKTP